MKYISFVVDAIPLHYYQAQLLLLSLDKNTKFTRNNIVVQCTPHVSEHFLGYLQKEGYTYTIITPYLDGKYCNKLAQLDYFVDKKIQSVILLDADMYVLDNALFEMDHSVIMGKIVDAPNPPLKTIERIFQEANLILPPVVHTDWEIPANETVEGNFNGGFYYIPGVHLASINRYWKKWASWLFARDYLFDNPSHAIHTDQLSFAMALRESKIPYTLAETNYNFPLHSPLIPSYFDPKAPLHLLHYHREIDPFGYIDTDKITIEKVRRSVLDANKQIGSLKQGIFYHLYKRSLHHEQVYTPQENTAKQCETLCSTYPDIILYFHAGTPKTATTTFQYTCAQNSTILKNKKVLYPRNYSQTGVPKHQWIVSLLLEENFEMLLSKIAECYDEAVQTACTTIILSTEGIYNHWYDFTDKAKSFLLTLAQNLRPQILLTVREPYSFMYSFYQQNLKNPRIPLVQCYGQDWSFERMLEDKWFKRHLDYLGFIYDMETIFGISSLQIFTYKSTIINELFETLNIDYHTLKHIKNKNTTLSPAAIEVLITLNAIPINPQDKKKIIEQLFSCDTLLKQYNLSVNNQPAEEKIHRTFILQRMVLEDIYGISFPSIPNIHRQDKAR